MSVRAQYVIRCDSNTGCSNEHKAPWPINRSAGAAAVDASTYRWMTSVGVLNERLDFCPWHVGEGKERQTYGFPSS